MPAAIRILSPTAKQALALLGGLIEEGRLRKGWSRAMLAERVGVGALTIRRVTRGEPGVAIGTYSRPRRCWTSRCSGRARPPRWTPSCVASATC